MKPYLVVLDGGMALKRIYGEDDYNSFLRSIAHLCKSKGVTLLVTIMGDLFK